MTQRRTTSQWPASRKSGSQKNALLDAYTRICNSDYTWDASSVSRAPHNPLRIVQHTCILYFIIVMRRRHFETTAPRGLKFWLQIAFGPPISTRCAEIRKSGSGSGKSGFSPEIFFRFFRFYGPLGTSGTLPGGSRTT